MESYSIIFSSGLGTKTDNEIPTPGHVKDDIYPVLVWGENNFQAMNMDTNQTLNCHIPSYPVDLIEGGVATFIKGERDYRILVCGGIPNGYRDPWFDLCFEYYGSGNWKLSIDFWGELPESGKFFIPSITKVLEVYEAGKKQLWAISSEYPVNHIYRDGAWVPGPALPVDSNFCAMQFHSTIMITGNACFKKCQTIKINLIILDSINAYVFRRSN